MLSKNAVNEYSDVGLCGNVTYNKDDVCKIVESRIICGVVGKMHQAVLQVASGGVFVLVAVSWCVGYCSGIVCFYSYIFATISSIVHIKYKPTQSYLVPRTMWLEKIDQ